MKRNRRDSEESKVSRKNRWGGGPLYSAPSPSTNSAQQPQPVPQTTNNWTNPQSTPMTNTANNQNMTNRWQMSGQPVPGQVMQNTPPNPYKKGGSVKRQKAMIGGSMIPSLLKPDLKQPGRSGRKK